MSPTTSTEVRVDLRFYPLLAIQKTIAALSRRCALELSQDTESTVIVAIRSRSDAQPLTDPSAEFLALLGDIALQDRLAEQTKDIRAALLRAAFHEALPPIG